MSEENNSSLSRTAEDLTLPSLQSNSGTVQKTSENIEDGQTSSRSKYEIFFCLISYYKMFLYRLGKDLIQSVMFYFYSDRVLPEHILDLINAQKQILIQRDLNAASCSTNNVVKSGTFDSISPNSS